MSPLPYTTISLCLICPLHTASTVSTAYCIHCLLHPLHTVSTDLTFLGPKTMPDHHMPLFHCIHWFDLFGPNTMSPPPYTAIPLHPMHPLIWPFCTKDIVPTTIYRYFTMSKTSTGLTFLHQRQCPHHHMPLFHCIHWLTFCTKNNVPTTIYHIPLHPLHLLIWPFCTKDNVPNIIYHYSTASTASTGLTFLHQRQCLHHHIPQFHYVHHIHW